ncbi:MAG TPA: hypothetical protein VGO37_18385 [Steroidobacteraceae bacterium]|jgi:hypothetical protein|nr:hypothetical protein [Steroidobacteraceae bacterium]
MKQSIAAMMIILGGCASGTLPWAQGPQLSEPECVASCDAHYDQCPLVFANFPERGAIECPAEHNSCLKTCEGRRGAASAAPPATAAPAAAPGPLKVPAAMPTPAPAPAVANSSVSSKEARLRELKHLYDEGLVSDDVYRERQRSILSEP